MLAIESELLRCAPRSPTPPPEPERRRREVYAGADVRLRTASRFMTAVYAIVLVLAIVAFLGWIAATAVARTVDGRDGADPERRFGVPGRFAVAGAMGFGLGGMSATFAGWPAAVAFLAALGGGALLIGTAWRYGPDGDSVA